MGDKPKGVGLWVEVNGEWVQLGSVEGPSLISFFDSFPPKISIGYDLKPGDLIPDVPKLKAPEPLNVELTLKKVDFDLGAINKVAGDAIADAQKEFVAWCEDQMTKALLYGDPNAPEPTGIMNTKPFQVEEKFNLLPPFPPNHFNCKCSLPPLEEPPPPSWRELAAAFEMTNGRRPIAAPTGLELEASLSEHFGSTDPVVKAKE